MRPIRSLFVTMVATVVLIGARPGAETQFPRGLMAAGPTAPATPFCTIETRPLSFGNFDPDADVAVDVVTQVIYTCNNQSKKIRIEMTTGAANLTNSKTKILVSYPGRPEEGLTTHNWVVADRRYSIVLRGTF